MEKVTNTYTALLTGNLRDTTQLSPKVLLLDVRYEDGTLFRDHTWTLKQYFKQLPKSHSKRKWKITFTAREQEYMSSEGTKTKLVKVKVLSMKK